MTATCPTPPLSVVIAASNGAALLRECLEALYPQARASGAEVIVARNYDGGAGPMLRADFGAVIDMPLRSETTVPVLRAEGVRHARGRVIAVLEDHCACAPGWCAAVLEAHRSRQRAAVGGPVEPAPDGSALDWAVYFYDYGRFEPPCPSSAGALPGCNMTFSREALMAVEPVWRGGLFEVTLFPAIRQQGHGFWIAPDAVVMHHKHYQFRAAITQSWHLARGYAAQRGAAAGSLRRVGLVVASPALLILLPLRTVLRALARGRHVGQVIRALAALVALQWTWSAGEMAGYLTGAGPSAERWR